MTRDELRVAGETLFGEGWQTALARELGVADRTVRRWLSGQIPIGERVGKKINRLLSLRGHSPVGEPVLHHVTLNNGHLAITARGEITPEVIAWLAPMVQAGKGEPAGISFGIDRRTDGSALVVIGRPPAVLCGVCWAQDRSAGAWSAMIELMRSSGMMQAPDGPPPAPWLAVLTLPAMYQLPPETIAMLGDMERCLAWTLIES